jgi:hypothetical protein
MSLAGWIMIAQLTVKGDQTVKDATKAIKVVHKYIIKKGARRIKKVLSK